MQTVTLPVVQLNPYENNPRTIDENGFELLKQSLTDFPEMLAAQPLIVSDRTGQFVVLGGNQRLAAAKELGLESLPCIVVSGWDEEMERRAVITANTHFGNEFDPQALANEIWAQYNLPEWGVSAEVLADWENAVERGDWDGIDRESEDGSQSEIDEKELIGTLKIKEPEIHIKFITAADLIEFEADIKFRLAEKGATWKVINGQI